MPHIRPLTDCNHSQLYFVLRSPYPPVVVQCTAIYPRRLRITDVHGGDKYKWSACASVRSQTHTEGMLDAHFALLKRLDKLNEVLLKRHDPNPRTSSFHLSCAGRGYLVLQGAV